MAELLKLPRSQCSILPLVLKGKWFDMIASGEKREEYRLPTLYWRKRLHNWDRKFTENTTPVVEFRRGYAKEAVGLPVILFAPDRRPTLLTSALSRLETAPWRHSVERFSNPNQNFLRNPNALPPPDSHSLHAASGAIPRNSRLPRA